MLFKKTMKAQVPAEGIMKTHDFGDSKFFRIDCTCGNADDTIDMMVSYEEDIQEIEVHFDAIQQTDWWKTVASWDTYKIDNPWLYSIVNGIQCFINGFHHRLKVTKEVWFNGYVKYSGTTYLTKQQALNFAETIKRSIDEIEQHHKVKEKEKKKN